LPGRTTSATALAEGVATPRTAALSPLAFRFLVIVVVVQGGHVIEHIVQTLQVFVFAVPEDDALGLLGYVLQFNGTEEWLHLAFNSVYLLSLYALILPLWRITPAVLPTWAFAVFVAASVWVETWHMVEHGVIISNVIANGGCPCPGIGDAALGVSDTLLHLFYNGVAYAGVALALLFVLRDRGDISRWRGRRVSSRFARHEATRRDKRDRVRLSG
jgi:hypothetical protein